MKTLFPIFALGLFLNVGAQDQWNVQASGTSNNLYSIQFPDRDTGYVVGAAGTILKSVNGGAAWVSKTSGTNQPLYAVSFFDKQTDTGYAVGGGGALLKTGDKGTTWLAQSSGTQQALRCVIGKGPLALTCGDSGIILRTVNGGATWSRASSSVTYPIYSVAAIQLSSGIMMFAVGSGGGLKSSDTGKTWTSLFTTSQSGLLAVYFDSLTGLAAGSSGTLLKTANGGGSWSATSSGTAQTLNSIDAQDSGSGHLTTVYLVGNAGTILRSNNGGSTWTAQTSNTTQALNSVCFPHQDSIFSVYTAGNGGVILKNIIYTSPVFPQRLNDEQLGISNGKLWYQLPRASGVDASLFDSQGRCLLKMKVPHQTAGYHEMALPAKAFSEETVLEFRTEGFSRTLQIQAR